MRCYWCDEEIERWYIKYQGHYFCKANNDRCIKDYLYDRADDDFVLDYIMPRETEFEAACFKNQIKKDLEGDYS